VGVYIVTMYRELVEDYVILLSIMMFGVFALAGMKMFQGKSKPKTKEKSAQESLIKTYETNIERLSIELKKQVGRASRLQALRDGEKEYIEEADEMSNKQVTFEEITALVNTQAPKYAKLLPLVKKQVMEATEGMTMEEVLNYVKQFTGNKQSEGSLAAPESIAYRTDWA